MRSVFTKKRLARRKTFLPTFSGSGSARGLPVPDAWNAGHIKWVTIEDFDAKGLVARFPNRMSDFWGYWLEFRRVRTRMVPVAAAAASAVSDVPDRIPDQDGVGYTRRHSDGETVVCGMSILKALPDGNHLLSTHAYLAKAENESIYDLYDTPEFHSAVKTAFSFNGYSGPEGDTGLGLAIPYPHEELDPQGILASAIEHFAPAILAGTLVVRVNDTVLDASTIEDVAHSVVTDIRTDAIRKDIGRYLTMIRTGLAGPFTTLAIDDLRNGFAKMKESATIRKLQTAAAQNNMIALRIEFPLEQNGQKSDVSLKAVLALTPDGKGSIDRLFREGMSLPDVKAKNPGEFDLVILVEDNALATYLNFCEGKAHLDLLELKEIRAKLDEKGYSTVYRVKRFVRNLPVDLRNLLTPDVTDPDASVFDDFFAVDDNTPGDRPGPGNGSVDPPPPPTPPPEPKPPVFIIDKLDDGFRAKANPAYTGWPVNLSITMAYADGSRKPGWSEFDFRPSDLTWSGNGCTATLNKNRLQASGCGPDTMIEVTGFDAKREIDTRIRVWKDAQAN